MSAIEAQPIRTLAPRYYLDPAVYATETRKLFATTWQFACHISEVAEPGDYVTFMIGDQTLLVVRGQDGAIRGFHNVCQHRAHELLRGSGNCRAIVCPYHAWTYDLDGKLRGATNSGAVAGFDRDAIRLAEVRAERFCGFVFVNLDADAQPMAAWFPGVEAELSAFVPEIDRLRPLQWLEIPERCNWKVSVENYNECYHCTRNHPTFSKGVVRPETYNIVPQGYCLRHTTESANLERMSYPIDLAASATAGSYRSWFLWPMFSFQVYPGNLLNTYHWRPVDHASVTVWRGWHTVDGADSDVVRKLAAQDRATTVQEDIRIVESVQRGLRSNGYRPGPLVIDPRQGLNSEHSIRTLHDWMRAAVEEG